MRMVASVAIALLLVATVITAAAIFRDRGESTLARVERTDSIRLGYAWEPPYAFRDDQGRVTGEAPEVARAVLQAMGISRTEWVLTDFSNLIPELLAGRFDVIAAGMFVRPERERLVAFTAPSACIEPALLVRRGNPLALHRLEDVAATPPARLAVLSGAVEENDAHQAGIPPPRIVAFASADQAVNGLLHGLADGLALSGPTVQWLATHQPELERAAPFTGVQRYSGCAAFAFRPQDERLRLAFDRELNIFLGSPAHLALIERFGFGWVNLPPHAP